MKIDIDIEEACIKNCAARLAKLLEAVDSLWEQDNDICGTAIYTQIGYNGSSRYLWALSEDYNFSLAITEDMELKVLYWSLHTGEELIIDLGKKKLKKLQSIGRKFEREQEREYRKSLIHGKEE